MKRCLLAFLFLCATAYHTMSQRSCRSQEYLQQLLQTDPELAQRISRFEAAASSANKEILSQIAGGTGPGSSVIRIPVVVHVLYNSPVQNVSDAQIQSQIDALNRDFRRRNDDTVKTPAAFRHLAADCQFEFVLANVDPKGFVTTGIIRKHTNIQLFGIDDRIKSSANGGDDPWDSNSYLNIWVGQLAGSLIGYASPVYGDRNKDGVAINYSAFGTMGTAGAPFNKGRVLVHEVGHWLGLRHIWGDRACGDDYVDDTPPQQTSSYGCVTGSPTSCGNSGNMYMNYMDLTFDACTNLFTQGQKAKMRSLFAKDGWREALLSSKAADGNGRPVPVESPIDTVAASIGLFPNPVQSMLTIDVKADEQQLGKTVTVYNHLGQQVLQARLTKQVLQLNMRSLQEGMYFVRIGDNKKVYKVVKSSTILTP